MFRHLDFYARTDIVVPYRELHIKTAKPLRAYLISEENAGNIVTIPSLMHLIVALRCKDEASVRRMLSLTSSFSKFDSSNDFVVNEKWVKTDSIGILVRKACKHRLCCKYKMKIDNNLPKDFQIRNIQVALEMLVRYSRYALEIRNALRASGRMFLYYRQNSGYDLKVGGKFFGESFDGENLYGRLMMDMRSTIPFNEHSAPSGASFGVITLPPIDAPPVVSASTSVTESSSRIFSIENVMITPRAPPDDHFIVATHYRFLNQSTVGVFHGNVCFAKCLQCGADIRSPSWEREGPIDGLYLFCSPCERHVDSIYSLLPYQKRREIENRIFSKFIDVERDSLAAWRVYHLDLDDTVDQGDLTGYLQSIESIPVF